jgi:hypothetical protein
MSPAHSIAFARSLRYSGASALFKIFSKSGMMDG